MMRVLVLLLLALALAAVLAAFPDVAEQPLRIEAFGWLFETRQGPFVLLLLMLLGGLWLLRRIVSALLAGPEHIWQALRLGGRKRKEAQLRDGLAQLIDMRGDFGARIFRKTQGILPAWGHAMLRALAVPAAEHSMPSNDDDSLLAALKARIVTDPHAVPKPDPALRKAHLERWLEVHPGAPLAIQRKMDLAEEEGDWAALAKLLEQVWKQGGSSAASIRSRLARAYRELARLQPQHELEYLRKAHRLQPESAEILLALGRALEAKGDVHGCEKLWSAYLEAHDEQEVAVALHALLRKEPLKAYRKLESADEAHMPPARAWLRAQLAHDAGLSGLAMDHMQELVKKHPSRLVWRTFGDWHAEEGEWTQAARCYQKALQYGAAGSAVDTSGEAD